MPADLVVRNGRVFTVDDARPTAEAIAVGGERIAIVGSDEQVQEFVGPGTEVLDAAGATVIPGFVDAHNHVRLGGGGSETLELFGATSLDQIRAMIGAHLDAHQEATWVEAVGWNYAAIPGGSPDAAMLDGATRGLPAILWSYDAHTAWLNREAMSRLGIDRTSERLPWGTVEKDPDSGEPTGYVLDFAVYGISEEGQRALAPVLPSYAPEAQYEALVRSLDMAISYGITTIVEPQNGLDDVALFERARAEGTLRSRLVAAMLCLPGTTSQRLDDLQEAKRSYDDDRFRVGPIKLYIDDVIEPHTAAMLEPYANADTTGQTFWSPREYSEFVLELERRGFQAFTHATGDRGIRTALDAVEGCRRIFGDRDARHQIVHVECVHPDDVPRFGQLGVVACMQPRHCAPDIVAEWRANVGPDREPGAWPFRSIAAWGGVLAFSSDWNVAEMDPMTWLYTATTRADLDGNGAWNTAETVDLPTAIRASTLGSAYANFADHDRGSITEGKYADLAVLDRDLLACEDPLEILQARVVATVVGGKVVAGGPGSG